MLTLDRVSNYLIEYNKAVGLFMLNLSALDVPTPQVDRLKSGC